MAVNDLKKELITFIAKTNNEELLFLLKEDFLFYGTVNDADITDNLNNQQIEELRALSQEDEGTDVHSLDEFKMATQQWRAK